MRFRKNYSIWKTRTCRVLLTGGMAAMLLMGCGKYEPVELKTEPAYSGQITETVDLEPGAEENAAGENVAGENVAGEPATAETSYVEQPVTTETAPTFQEVNETVYLTGDDVNVRTGCSTSAQSVAKLSKGVSLKRTGISETWSRVIYQDQEHYVSSRYLSLTQPETENGKLIAIDAGHQAKGNSEKEPIGPGASTSKAKVASGTAGVSTGLPEYKLNLAVSLELKEELLARGYRVYMVRETHDVNISNAERAEMANNSGADIFVRVHANSLSDSSVRGALTMCMTKDNPYNANLYSKSSALSRLVTDGICAQTGFKNRGVQEVDTMSGINWCKIPVTIVEMGFMSNPEEDQLMASAEYQEKIAKGIADGIDAYYQAGN